MPDLEEKTPEELPGHEWEQIKRALATYRWQLLVLIAACLVVIVGIPVYRNLTASWKARRTQTLEQARTLQELETWLMRHPKSKLAPMATLRAAKAYYNAGDYYAAHRRYEEFLRKYPDHDLAPAAQLGMIHCLQAQGETETAILDYIAFAAEHRDHYLYPQAVFGQVQCLRELGRTEEARQICEEFITAHPDSEWRARAERILAELAEKKNAPSPAPASHEEATP